jgi:hypothetical protein
MAGVIDSTARMNQDRSNKMDNICIIPGMEKRIKSSKINCKLFIHIFQVYKTLIELESGI